MSLRYAVLALLEHESMTGYEIARLFDASVGHFWSARHQQIYRELGELAGRGWVRYEVIVQQERPDAKRYGITADGHAALVRWVEAPLADARPREPLLLKLLAAPAVPRQRLIEAFDRQLEHVDRRLQAYRDIAARHYDPPPGPDQPLDRATVLYLSLTRGLSAAGAYRDWLIETRARLGAGPS